jgi:hypothetical protein
LPATAADKTADRDRQAAALRRQLKKIETSQAALMTELEETGPDPQPPNTGSGSATAPPNAPGRNRPRQQHPRQHPDFWHPCTTHSWRSWGAVGPR